MTGPAGEVGAIAVGCDVVDVERLSRVLDRRPAFLARVFTDAERDDARRGGVAEGSPTERARLAARFAAKEATRKALGDLRLGFTAVEVRSGPAGVPSLWLHGRPAGLACSLSHDAGVAIALVVGPAIAGPTGATRAATPLAAPPTAGPGARADGHRPLE